MYNLRTWGGGIYSQIPRPSLGLESSRFANKHPTNSFENVKIRTSHRLSVLGSYLSLVKRGIPYVFIIHISLDWDTSTLKHKHTGIMLKTLYLIIRIIVIISFVSVTCIYKRQDIARS